MSTSPTIALALTCPHWGLCGGCKTAPDQPPAPPPYEQQLQQKENWVRELLASFDVQEWRPILPSPDIWYYRNKMEFAFSAPRSPAEGLGLSLGLRQAGSFARVVDLETCLLMSRESADVLRLARLWALDRKLTGYHRKAHVGDLRYLVLREGKKTGQRMAILIASTAPSNISLDHLRHALEPLVTTCWLGVTDTRSDVARADDMRCLWGSGALEETLGALRFRISPYSFFQTNTHGTERLYGLLREWANDRGGGALIDLYCGSGGIGLSLAAAFDRVIGIDTNAEAIADAKINAELNGLGQTEFVAEDALEFLKKLPASKLSVQISAMVVDPPRPGLHPKALEPLLEMNPPHLAYISCNPEALARDLVRLVPLYRIVSVQPVDLFPHTAHVETIALLEHR